MESGVRFNAFPPLPAPITAWRVRIRQRGCLVQLCWLFDGKYSVIESVLGEAGPIG